MPKTPRISIIIPAYNGERYLDECIQSVYQQTCPDFEIIVVDDCSTDDTAVIVKRLQDSYGRLRYFKNEKNLGTAGSRNLGIRESKADLIGFLDQDDRWYPTYLETQLRILDSNSDIDCLYCDYDFLDEASNVTNLSSYPYMCEGEPPINHFGMKSIWENQYIVPSSAIIRKSALFDVGLFSGMFYEDTNLWLKLAVRHGISATCLILVSYRRHEEQKTSDAWKAALGRTEAYQDAVRAYPEIRDLVGRRRFAEVMHGNTLLAGNYWFWMEQDYTRAAKYLWQAYLCKPSDLGTMIKLVWCWTPSTLRKPLRAIKTALNSG